MRNPNGINVRKLSGKRRKPYEARKLIGYRKNDEKRSACPIYKSIGYFATRKEALEAALAYEKNPLQFDMAEITFKQIFDIIIEKKEKTLNSSTISNYKGAFKYYSTINDRKFVSLRASDYEQLIDDEVPRTIQALCRVILVQMYEYAIKNDLCSKNIGKYVDFGKSTRTELVRKIYTKEEIDLVRERASETVFKITLLCLYTGFRPGEASIIKKDKVFIEDGYIQEGLKTEAGRDRKVPIHEDILPLVKKWKEEADKRSGDTLFITESGKPMTMRTYSLYFRDVMKDIGMEHMPHDARHTFITNAAHCGMSDYIIKLIVGHKVSDVTKDVYTHTSIEDMKNELKKFKY